MGFLDESCGRRTVEKRQQRVEISVYIDKPARFSVQPELGPGQQFRHFFYGAESSGQGDESVGQPEHDHLPFVHGVNDAQFRQAPMGNPVRKGSGDDSGDPPARTQNGVGDSAHEAGLGPVVHELDIPLGQHGAQPFGHLHVNGGKAGVGAAIHAYSFHKAISADGQEHDDLGGDDHAHQSHGVYRGVGRGRIGRRAQGRGGSQARSGGHAARQDAEHAQERNFQYMAQDRSGGDGHQSDARSGQEQGQAVLGECRPQAASRRRPHGSQKETQAQIPEQGIGSGEAR